MEAFRVEDVELGDKILVDGRLERVYGWFIDARGRVMVLHGPDPLASRWHPYHRGTKFERKRRRA